LIGIIDDFVNQKVGFTSFFSHGRADVGGVLQRAEQVGFNRFSRSDRPVQRIADWAGAFLALLAVRRFFKAKVNETPNFGVIYGSHRIIYPKIETYLFDYLLAILTMILSF